MIAFGRACALEVLQLTSPMLCNNTGKTDALMQVLCKILRKVQHAGEIVLHGLSDTR